MRKPTVPEVLPIAHSYYQLGQSGDVLTACGGSLHIVLDDENLETPHVEGCIETAIENHDRAGELLARVLLRMSLTQRGRIAHLHDGYRYRGDEMTEAEIIAACEALLSQ
jgi:hypothetical protein